MNKRILLVDDSQTVIMLERMMLGRGYDIAVARDGRQMLETVASWRPDLVLLDIMMPEMDGITACGRLKGDPATAAIPVIMVTTKGDEERVRAAFAAGCNDYLNKPIDRTTLLEKVRAQIGDP